MIKLFASPVNASNYIADFGTAKGVELHLINYETGEVHFSLVDSDDVTSPIVNGVTIADASETTAAAEIRALVDATN